MLSDDKTKILHGYVHNDGYLLWASKGVQARKVSTGSYQLIFSPRFAKKPTVITQIHNAQYFVCVTTLDAGYCAIVTSGSAGGAAADLPFMFMAMGLERSGS
jgi:hypothetical protein